MKFPQRTAQFGGHRCEFGWAPRVPIGPSPKGPIGPYVAPDMGPYVNVGPKLPALFFTVGGTDYFDLSGCSQWNLKEERCPEEPGLLERCQLAADSRLLPAGIRRHSEGPRIVLKTIKRGPNRALNKGPNWALIRP